MTDIPTHEPFDDEYVRAAVNEQIRQQFGRHRLVNAPDGGCTRCPLSAGDQIHTDQRLP